MASSIRRRLISARALLSAPILWLLATTVLFCVEAAFAAAYEQDIPRATESLWMMSLGFGLAWWVRSDRKAQGWSAPFEFEAFVFFGWLVVVPYYLCRTRGVRGALWAVPVWGLYLLPMLVSTLACFECES